MERKEPLATTALPGIDKNAEREADKIGPTENKYGEDAAAKTFLVLVVDDSVDNVVLLSLDLQREGYRVVTASNGEEAITIAALTQPNIILMDLGMPHLDGLAATRRIRENESLRDVPVIAITAFSTEGFQRAAYDVGIAGYLVKPIDYGLLQTLLSRVEPTRPAPISS